MKEYVEGLAQDCSNSIVKALELLQSCAKHSMWSYSVNLALSTDSKTFRHKLHGIIESYFVNLMKQIQWIHYNRVNFIKRKLTLDKP